MKQKICLSDLQKTQQIIDQDRELVYKNKQLESQVEFLEEQLKQVHCQFMAERLGKEYLMKEVGKSHAQMVSKLHGMQTDYLSHLAQFKQATQKKHQDQIDLLKA